MRLVPWRKKEIERGGYSYPITMDQYASYFTYNNNVYPFGVNQTLRGSKEEIGTDYPGLINGAYKSNGVIFACMALRQLVFSEARFQFRQLNQGRPGNLFGTQDLSILEQPMPGHTTGDMLATAIMDADLAGNWFGYRDGDRIYRLRPDWVTIVLGSNYDAKEAIRQYDAEVIGYLYHPGGDAYDEDPVPLDVREVAHFSPMKDPSARFRGMSWLTPVIREIMADSQSTNHKLKFFENGATPNMIVKLPEDIRADAFNTWVDKFKAGHEGAANAYRSLFLAGGADATVVGANFQQMDFKVTQGAGETRIAAAARVHPVLVGLSEGLQGSSLNAGNFGAARRSTADMCFRPLWRNMAGSLQKIVTTPGRAELWYDDRDIAFLREDAQDIAQIQQMKAVAIKTLVDAGYDTQSVVDAIEADDLARLQHTGLISVQLQPAGAAQASANGNGSAAVVLPGA